MAILTDKRGRRFENDKRLARVGGLVTFPALDWFGTITQLEPHARVDWRRPDKEEIYDNQQFDINYEVFYFEMKKKPIIIITNHD